MGVYLIETFCLILQLRLSTNFIVHKLDRFSNDMFVKLQIKYKLRLYKGGELETEH